MYERDKIWDNQRLRRKPMFRAILLTFFSENVVAFRRLVISFRRGCLHVPGLSTIGVGFCGVDLTGVLTAARLADEDIVAEKTDETER